MASAMQEAHDWASDVDTDDEVTFGGHSFNIVRTVRLVGGAMITILLTAVVLNEVFGAVSVGSGPFSQIGTDLQTTGVAAIGLLVVGLIIIAANRLMSIFGGNGGM